MIRRRLWILPGIRSAALVGGLPLGSQIECSQADIRQRETCHRPDMPPSSRLSNSKQRLGQIFRLESARHVVDHTHAIPAGRPPT
jgi:hypothetical protein